MVNAKFKIQTNQANSNINGTAISPYEIPGYGAKYDGTTSGKFTMTGIDYTQGFVLGGNGCALFNLDGQYNNIRVRVGHIDGSFGRDGTITIYLNGKQSQQIEVNCDDVSKVITIPVNKAIQMKIEFEDSDGLDNATGCGFSNMIGY